MTGHLLGMLKPSVVLQINRDPGRPPGVTSNRRQKTCRLSPLPRKEALPGLRWWGLCITARRLRWAGSLHRDREKPGAERAAKLIFGVTMFPPNSLTLASLHGHRRRSNPALPMLRSNVSGQSSQPIKLAYRFAKSLARPD